MRVRGACGLREFRQLHDVHTRLGELLDPHRAAPARPPSTPGDGNACEQAASRYALDTDRDDQVADRIMWDLRDTLPPVRGTDTRAEYAARVRLIVEGVAQ
ncbi:hypothetical protein [Streptomyces sp. NPDC056632]|uniref:hypothetical protein n=1 Tax=Streptomyces sp. NPDC056632 TaxID=3345884 RepID=UPI0036CEF1A2